MGAFPLAGGHACDSLEGTEERRFGGEARLHPYLRDLHVRLAAHQLLGVADTIPIDELREGAALLTIDTTGDGVAVGAKHSGYVGQFKVAVLIGLLLFHQVADALHQDSVGIWSINRGDRFMIGSQTTIKQPVPLIVGGLTTAAFKNQNQANR